MWYGIGCLVNKQGAKPQQERQQQHTVMNDCLMRESVYERLNESVRCKVKTREGRRARRNRDGGVERTKGRTDRPAPL